MEKHNIYKIMELYIYVVPKIHLYFSLVYRKIKIYNLKYAIHLNLAIIVVLTIVISCLVVIIVLDIFYR